jgi:Domain of unknown function (DUF4388)/HDOD domain
VRPYLSGRLDTFSIADLLQWMELNSRSGRLVLRRGPDKRTIDWKLGSIVYVSGSRPPDRLGFHLVASGALKASRVYSFLARNLSARESLTRLILDEGDLTHDQLAGQIEQLSRRLLLDLFRWRTGTFDYDPNHHVEDILRIHLKLKGQTIAFQGAKALDDSGRFRPPQETDEEGAGWERFFQPEEVEDSFWKTVTLGEDRADPDLWKQNFHVFRLFAEAIRMKLAQPTYLYPIFDDTARMIRNLFDTQQDSAEALLSVVGLDPFLMADLLVLGNALSVDRREAATNALAAVDRIGTDAFLALMQCLSRPEASTWKDGDSALGALQRASLAAAVAAGKFAESFEIDPDDAYSAGLIHGLPYADLFEVIRAVHFDAGPFRRDAIETYRPLVGRTRGLSWGLTPELEAVLGDEGDARAPRLVRLVRAARQAVPSCALGPTWDPADTVNLPVLDVFSDIERLFDLLGLGEP